MSNALISLLDITKRAGGDKEVGLLEDTIIYAPELGAIMGRPIDGTQYKTIHRTLPTVAGQTYVLKFRYRGPGIAGFTLLDAPGGRRGIQRPRRGNTGLLLPGVLPLLHCCFQNLL